MAQALKDRYFQQPLFYRLAEEVKTQYKLFDEKKFFKLLYDDQWEVKELKDRMMHSAMILAECLPSDYIEMLDVLRPIVSKFGDFDALIFPDIVRQFGLGYFEESMEALELFTQYSTAEFAIRPFILKYPERTMSQMLKWSTHENEHVRRLASEGCRPRLPWAMALPDYKKDPTLILPILENLKSGSSLYVRKSVANNWNDITKDNPDVVISTFKRWNKKPTVETKWIIKHALRGLLKAGHPEALQILGYGEAKVSVEDLLISSTQVKVGDKLEFSFTITNEGESKAELMADYIVHFMKANGSTAPKVFKLKTLKLDSGESVQLIKTHDFKLINTRVYHKGKHAIEIQVNGQCHDSVNFTLI